jgi:H+/Cl- antiporter ClcA
LAYVVPLSFGNGHQTNVSVISNVEHYSTHTLLVTAATRVFTLAISMNCGFVGGFVLPVISIGIVCGVICHQQYDYLPLGLCIACFMSSLPAAICPMPFTLFSIATSVFFFGLYQTVPVLVSCITSYLMLTGIGLLGALQERARQNQQAQQGKQEAPPPSSLSEREEPLNPYRRKEGRSHPNEL